MGKNLTIGKYSVFSSVLRLFLQYYYLQKNTDVGFSYCLFVEDRHFLNTCDGRIRSERRSQLHLIDKTMLHRLSSWTGWNQLNTGIIRNSYKIWDCDEKAKGLDTGVTVLVTKHPGHGGWSTPWYTRGHHWHDRKEEPGLPVTHRAQCLS